MAQKPVANALTLELEPVVADNLARFLESADEWYAHDYVPFDQGRNFAFLGGDDWDPSQATLPAGAPRTISATEFGALRRQVGDAQPIARLLWLAALGGSGGEIPGGAAGARYRLHKWPQIEREFPKHFRIATAMMKGFQMPAEFAEQSGVSLAEVNEFIAANLVSGHAEAEGQGASEAASSVQKSLLERLRGTR